MPIATSRDASERCRPRLSPLTIASVSAFDAHSTYGTSDRLHLRRLSPQSDVLVVPVAKPSPVYLNTKVAFRCTCGVRQERSRLLQRHWGGDRYWTCAMSVNADAGELNGALPVCTAQWQQYVGGVRDPARGRRLVARIEEENKEISSSRRV